MRDEICPQDTCRLRELLYWQQHAEQAEAQLAEIVGVANVYSSIEQESDESDAEYMVRASAAWKAVEAAVTKAEAVLAAMRKR